MNKDRKSVTQVNPAIRLFLVSLAILAAANIYASIKRAYDLAYAEYCLSFSIGEYYGLIQVLVDFSAYLGEITPEEYMEYQELNLELFKDYSKEKGQKVVEKVSSIIEDSDLVWDSREVTDMQGFRDGFMMRSNTVSLILSRNKGEISEKKFDELVRRRVEICENPKHSEVKKFVDEVTKILETDFLEDGDKGYDERGGTVPLLFDM